MARRKRAVKVEAEAKVEAAPAEAAAPLACIGGFRTKSGKSWHLAACRFSKVAVEITPANADGKLKPCGVCKPHLPASMRPVKSVGKETLAPCKVCKPDLGGFDSCDREHADSIGLKYTQKGKSAHRAECKHVGGPGVAKLLPAKGRKVGNRPEPLVNPLDPRGARIEPQASV